MEHQPKISTEKLETNPGDSASLPYPRWEYAVRLLWLLVQSTIWWLAWRRFYILRSALLKLFGAKASWKVGISASCRIHRPWAAELGEFCSIGPRVRVYNLGGFSLGKRSIISQDVYLCGGTHDYTDPHYTLVTRPIFVGDDVWICAGAFIGPGVKIGDGAVIGARAVVVKDVEPWTVVAGNPAQFIKKRELRNT